MKKFLCLMASAVIVAAVPVFGVEIVPKPVSMNVSEKTITVPHNISFYVLRPSLESLVPTWQEMYAPIAGVKAARTTDKSNVLLDFDPTLGREEYRLVVEKDPDKIIIAGGDVAGVWWGMQSLAQILLQCADYEGFELPCMEILDRPAFSYRGGMLDCGRHFFPVEAVLKYIDILAMHKLNTFHWHLTEDQGWRIEIRKYPKLTETGAWRRETGEDGKDVIYGGFYSQDEIRQVVSYAAARQITVIPEIEMPGHSTAALASYPELGCVGEGYEVAPTMGIKDDIFCAGNPDVLEFLKDVFDEVCELFPSEYINIGGDEAPTVRWEACPKCQAKKEELGLENVAYLHGYLLKNIEEYLNAKGRRIIGWDEILDAGITPTATVMSWRGPSGGKRAAKQGNDVIMAPNTNFYFDYYQTEDPEANGEPGAYKRYLPLSKVYSFDPYEELSEEERVHIVGIQANLWTEFICEFNHAEQMLLPRTCALAEDAWGSGKEDFETFTRRVKDVMVPLYEILGLNYAKYGFE